MDVKGQYKSPEDQKVCFATLLKLILPAKVFIFIRYHELSSHLLFHQV